MAPYPSMPQSNLCQFVQLPGRNALLAGGMVTLFTALVMISSAHLSRLDRQGRESKRQELLGTVRYQGELLARGRIRFICQIVEPELEAIDAEADIVDGQFHIPRPQGPMPGWFVIRILPEGLPPASKVANPSVITCRQDEEGPIRVPRGTDLFVRLGWRRANRFDLELHEPVSQLDGDSTDYGSTL